MSMRDLIPWGRGNNSPAPYRSEDPFLALHRKVNQLFDDVFRGIDLRQPSFPALSGDGFGWPSIEVGETDKEIRVAAEVPGLEEKDVEVLLQDGVLTLRGEKRSETGDSHFSERFYGRFERRIPIDAEIEEDKVTASFRNGVLNVTLPKSARAQSNVKRIPVTH